VRIAAIVLLVSCVAQLPTAFADQQDKPLGDVAREQRQVKKKTARKRYTNKDVATGAATRRTQTKGSQPKPLTSEAAPNVVASVEERKEDRGSGRTALDRPREPETETIIIPTGTQIKANIHAEEVTIPIRVGEKTAIPVSAKVTVKVEQIYDQRINGGYADMVELTSVAVAAELTTCRRTPYRLLSPWLSAPRKWSSPCRSRCRLRDCVSS
jgi:hypothetical protein